MHVSDVRVWLMGVGGMWVCLYVIGLGYRECE